MKLLTVVQGNFGFGWEDVTASLSPQEARTDLKAYRENDPDHAYRIVQRREREQED